MAEEKETGAGSEEEQQAEAPEEGGAEENPSGSEESEDTQGEQGEEEQGEEKDNLSDEPDTRNNAFFAGFRKGKKSEKEKQKDSQEQPEEEQKGGEESSADDELRQEVDAIKQQTQQQATDKEVDEFLQKNPEFSEFKDTVRKWANHESRQNIPVDSIFYEVAGKSGKLQQIIAQQTRNADAQKSKTQGSGGSSARGQPQGKGVWDMPDNEFERKKNDVKRRA